jgi:DNA-binding SARP family transcriptional activator/predicted ATPase
MPALTLTLLGQFGVSSDGAPITRFRGDKVRALLAYLAVESDRLHSRTALAAMFWPDQPDDQAHNNLSQALTRLRAALGDASACIEANRHSVRWSAEAGVDAVAFARLAEQGTPAALEQAVELYGGELLQGFALDDCPAFEEWLLLTRERLQQRALDTLARLADSYAAAGHHAPAANAARRQLALDPWHEPAYRQLIRALAAAGDRAGALAAYERCRHVLETDLGVAPDAETVDLVRQLRQDQPRRPAAALPAPRTPLLGREEELAALDRLLRGGARLVSLLGPGGIGKTRLALAAAHMLREAFADGVCWVPLAGERGDGDENDQHERLAGTILAALGNTNGRRAPTDELRETLRGRSLLLVLDNCEHVPAIQSLIDDLLAAAPGLHVLATSRVRLGVLDEELLQLEGLPVPARMDAYNARSAAVQLFLARAQRQVRGFGGDPQTLAGVVQLCRLLEGVPLGIELAAHWVGEYTPDEIAEAIRADVAFLESRDRHAPGRHRSLHAVFAHSWSLLNRREQRALARLAVFASGFDRQAALAVAEADAATLAALVDASLLRRVGSGRYSLHELLRHFAAEQLDERTAVEARHSAFYIEFALAREHRLARSEPLVAAAEIQAELDNLRQAWAWTVSHHQVAGLARVATCLWQFYTAIGRSAEFERLIETACTRLGILDGSPRDDAQAAATLLAVYAITLLYRGRYDDALRYADVALSRGDETSAGTVLGRFTYGAALYRKGQLHEGRRSLMLALDTALAYRQMDPSAEFAAGIELNTHMWLRAIDIVLGEFARARAHALEALRLCRAEGRLRGEVHALTNLADVAREVYDLSQAREHYELALQLVPGVSSRWADGFIRFELGDVVRLEGNYGRAQALMEQACAIFEEIGEAAQEYLTAASLARLHALMGDIGSAGAWRQRAARLQPSGASPEIQVNALLALTTYAHTAGDHEQALRYAEQCSDLASTAAHPYAQAHALVALGHTRAALRRPDAAQAYEAALALYERIGNPAPATEAWAGLASLALGRGDLAAAVGYAERILSTMGAVSRVGLDEPFLTYLACYRTLAAGGDARTGDVVRDADQLLWRYIAQLPDAVPAPWFLHNVPVHQALRAAIEQATLQQASTAAPPPDIEAPAPLLWRDRRSR